MNTTRDVWSGSGLGMPSGSEVESATFHQPVGAVRPAGSLERSGVRSRLETLKSRGLSKVEDVQQSLATRSSVIRGNVQRSIGTAKRSLHDEVNTRMSQMQSSMRENPAKWAGIAAGSGFALGMIGRFLQWRSKQHRHGPDIVIIDAMC